MAIEIVVGNVGSGKTYYATWRIWQEIKKIYRAEITGEKYKYTHILTNIEGFTENKYVKQLKVENLLKLYEEEVKVYKSWEAVKTKPVDFNDIDFGIKELEIDVDKIKEEELIIRVPNYVDNIKKFDSINDKILDYIKIANEKEKAYIEYTKKKFEETGFTDCLIVIDEAHNFFGRMSSAKERLISYHRHYDQDFLLITQDLKQLSRKVTGIAQKTIKAGNPILKGGKTFVYKVYSGGYISYRDTNLLEKMRLKADKDIFKLYSSGSVKQQKTYLWKLLLKWGSPAILVIIGFFWFLNNLKNSGLDTPGRETHKKIVVKKQHPKEKKSSKIKYVTLKVKKIGKFYIYKNKKYYEIDFRTSLMECNATLLGIYRNLDSTIIETYKLNTQGKKCLDTALLSASYL